MKYVIASFVMVFVLCAAATARADECTSAEAQVLARQGYAYLDKGDWPAARLSAGELAMYAKNCSDPKVGAPSAVHSAYIGAVALHEQGDDTKAFQAAQMGETLLEVLHKQGGFDDLYNALLPKFQALKLKLKVAEPQAQ